MRPSGRVLGALVLGALVFLVGGDYEVPWLLLIGFLAWVLVPAAWLYARANARRIEGRIELLGAEPGPDSPVQLLPRAYLEAAPAAVFEADYPRMRLELVSRAGEWGPAVIEAELEAQRLRLAAGRVTPAGHRLEVRLGAARRGPLVIGNATLETADPCGFFRRRTTLDAATALVLPRFAELGPADPGTPEEALLVAAQAGSGDELIGVREYRHGDPLRRIHWRSSARRGSLVVREYEPPGVPVVGILCQARPPSREHADQIARIAASEAWSVLRSGGRAYLWGPGQRPTGAAEAGSLWALLEWLALYPNNTGELAESPPRLREVVVVTSAVDAELRQAIDQFGSRGSRVRFWLVGVDEPDLPGPAARRVGLGWPLAA